LAIYSVNIEQHRKINYDLMTAETLNVG